MNFTRVAAVLIGVNRSITVLAAAALVLSGCTSGAGSDFNTTKQASPSTLGDTTTPSLAMTTSTSVVEDLASTTIALLDGSELKVVAPAQLELAGYAYSMEISALGMVNVYMSSDVDPASAASVEDTELHSDLGDGVKLWVGDREGRPFFMTVEMAEWVTLVHVGWETPPDSDFLASLADQLRGEASDRGVVIPDFDVNVFRTSLHDPHSEDSVELLVGQCLREHIPGSETVEQPNLGEMIRTPEYASWCEPGNDLEVTVSGAQSFVDRVVETLTLTRSSPAPEVSGWRRIPHDEADFGGSGDQVVTAVTAGPSSFVAVGSDDGSKAISWVSTDGSSWARNKGVGLEAEMEDVAWFDAGDIFVAVGHEVSDGATWTSPDGISWTRTALIPFSNPAGGIEIESVTDTEQGLVAGGKEWFGEGESIPAVWASSDGQTWTRAELDLSGIDQTTENGLVAIVGHQNDLFAVGFSWIDNIKYEPTVWASIDEAKWQEIDLLEEDAIDSMLNGFAVGDDGTLVMVGESEAEHVDSRTWVSEDAGQTWSRVEVERGAVGIPDLKDVTHSDSGWVVVGSDGTTRHENGERIAAVWHKKGSGAWTRSAPRDPQFRPHELAGSAGMTAVASLGGLIVAGGVDGTECEVPLEFRPCDLDAAFWIWDSDS